MSSYHREGPVTREDEVEVTTEATVKLWVDGERIAAVGEGNGPVNALDMAVRAALNGRYPDARIASTSPTSRCGSSTAARPPARSCGS